MLLCANMPPVSESPAWFVFSCALDLLSSSFISQGSASFLIRTVDPIQFGWAPVASYPALLRCSMRQSYRSPYSGLSPTLVTPVLRGANYPTFTLQSKAQVVSDSTMRSSPVQGRVQLKSKQASMGFSRICKARNMDCLLANTNILFHSLRSSATNCW